MADLSSNNRPNVENLIFTEAERLLNPAGLQKSNIAEIVQAPLNLNRGNNQLTPETDSVESYQYNRKLMLVYSLATTSMSVLALAAARSILLTGDKVGGYMTLGAAVLSAGVSIAGFLVYKNLKTKHEQAKREQAVH